MPNHHSLAVRRIMWVSSHRGVLSAIARKTLTSAQFVGMVLRGERASKDGRVERMLREQGAPLKAQ